MKGKAILTAVFGLILLVGAVDGHAAAKWVKWDVEYPNQNLDSNYYDAGSVKVKNKTLSWTEKYQLTDFGANHYTKHLSKYPACKEAIDKKGPAAYHQMDFELKQGKFRVVAKRNYSKGNELLCTNNDMGHELDSSWQNVQPKSQMMDRYYELRTKFKVGDL